MTSATGPISLVTRRTRAQSVVTSPWFAVVLVYTASRFYSSAILAGILALAQRMEWPFIGIRGKPEFFVFSGSWDGWFYRSIAERGYPTSLPVDALGNVLPNPWAFLPVFPLLERAVTTATGVTTFTAGAVVATVAGGGAAILLERLLQPHIGRTRALWAVALFCFGPLGFLLQAAYAESLFLLLLFAALLAMERSRYLTLIPIVVIAAFTRPGAIAIPAALVLQLGATWLLSRQRPQHLARAITALVITTAASLAWPYIADVATGQHGTYLATELSWWTGWVGRPSFVPFTPWFLITSRWLGPAGVVLAIALGVALVFWILRRSPHELGSTIRSYSVMYFLYLVAVFLPQFSLLRILMPLTPLLGAETFTATPTRQRTWLIIGAALQPAGVTLLWFLSYP